MLDEGNLKDANQAYLDTDYQLAQTIYQELVQEHPNNPMLLINLANSEYKIENNGKAIKHYYQAKRISPRSEEVNNNLAIVLEEIKLSQDPMLAYSGLSIFESLIFFLIFNILYLMRKKLNFNSSLIFIVVLCLVISSANLAWLAYEQKNIKRVVVTDISTKAYSGDSEAYSELFELLDGQILQLVKPGPDWSQIKYGESLGWLKNSSYELI